MQNDDDGGDDKSGNLYFCEGLHMAKIIEFGRTSADYSDNNMKK